MMKKNPGFTMLLGLRTVIYRQPDIAAARQWYTKIFAREGLT